MTRDGRRLPPRKYSHATGLDARTFLTGGSMQGVSEKQPRRKTCNRVATNDRRQSTLVSVITIYAPTFSILIPDFQ
jgi:hypothetical protein